MLAIITKIGNVGQVETIPKNHKVHCVVSEKYGELAEEIWKTFKFCPYCGKNIDNHLQGLVPKCFIKGT